MLAVSSIDWEAVGHWSTLAQGLFAFLTFLATVVYVGFTYHIMRWAVGQGKATLTQTAIAMQEHAARRDMDLRRICEFEFSAQSCAALFLTGMKRVPDLARGRLFLESIQGSARLAMAKGSEVTALVGLDGEMRTSVSKLASSVMLVDTWAGLVIESLGDSSKLRP